MECIIITIDGASSTGKSSLAKAIAKHYGFKHIDSGAMYRALTFYAQDYNLLSDHKFDVETLIARLPTIDIDFTKKDSIMLNGQIIEDEVRSMEVSNKVSLVAKEPQFRQFMVAKQRQLGAKGNVVMDGRDIGSVVFPNATIKFFLEASMEVRTNRRYAELIEKGEPVSIGEVQANIAKRDYIDSNRDDSPLIVPENAIVLSNDKEGMSGLFALATAEIDKRLL
ncbi:MAG: (d)CMP kinase [Flavobacteriaceae bacterium]|jgi:CMP/dCMP kinase|nr:(d)CMP kinase [Flavobacteriaceae bacterium]